MFLWDEAMNGRVILWTLCPSLKSYLETQASSGVASFFEPYDTCLVIENVIENVCVMKVLYTQVDLGDGGIQERKSLQDGQTKHWPQDKMKNSNHLEMVAGERHVCRDAYFFFCS